MPPAVAGLEGLAPALELRRPLGARLRADPVRMAVRGGDTGSSFFGGGFASSATLGSLPLLLPPAALALLLPATPPLPGRLALREEAADPAAGLAGGVLRLPVRGSGETLISLSASSALPVDRHDASAVALTEDELLAGLWEVLLAGR